MRAVIVTYNEADWAIIFTAWREQDGRRGLEPLLIIPTTSVTFAGFGGSGVHSLSTDRVHESARKKCLETAVEDYIRDARLSCQVLECGSPGFINNIRAAEYDAPLAGFELAHEYTVRWLCQSPKADKVLAALRLVRWLADKHGLTAPTREETDNAEQHRLLNQRM